MKYILLSIVIFTQLLYSQTASGLDNYLNNLQNTDELKHASLSAYAEYVDNGNDILSYNSEMGLAPASGQKVFTTSVALSVLGENYTYKTRLYYTGEIAGDGTLEGNIYIVGGGDPTLGSDQVKGSLKLDDLMHTWVDAVKKAGIKKINGAVISDDLLFDGIRVPDYWPWMDIGNYYGAGTCALTINDNLYYLYFKPGPYADSDAEVLRTEPEIPGLNFINYMKTGPKGSGDNGYIYCAPGEFKATLRGTVPAGVNEFSIKGAIPDPALFAAQYFSSELTKEGIPVAREADKLKNIINYADDNLLFTTVSPPLKDIVYITNKKSNNLYTQQLLKTIALHETGVGSNANGIKVIKSFFEKNGIPTGGFKLYDGCGLSRTNTITTKMMAKLLAFLTTQKIFKSFYHSLAVAGDPADIGYFKNLGKDTPLANNVSLKSGLITGVRSMSGYLKNKAGRLITFSFIANNYKGSSRKIDSYFEQLLLKIYNQ